jgi:hypothetical protein
MLSYRVYALNLTKIDTVNNRLHDSSLPNTIHSPMKLSPEDHQ